MNAEHFLLSPQILTHELKQKARSNAFALHCIYSDVVWAAVIEAARCPVSKHYDERVGGGQVLYFALVAMSCLQCKLKASRRASLGRAQSRTRE